MTPEAIIAIKDKEHYHAIYCGSKTSDSAKHIIKILQSHFNTRDSAVTLMKAGNLADIDSEGYYQYTPFDGDIHEDHLPISHGGINEIIDDAKLGFIKHIFIFIDNQWEAIHL